MRVLRILNPRAPAAPTLAVVAALGLLLAACGGGGGGGGSGGSTPPPVQADYTVSVDVTGLAGSGLTLELNGGDALSVAANGTATFSTAIATGTGYAVTVSQQPTSPAQTCTVKDGTGTMGSANVSAIAVTCASTPAGSAYSVTVNVTGLTGSGLTVVLNGGSGLEVAANGGANVAATFATLLDKGASYAVTVGTQPTGQTCVLSGASGVVGTADVTVNLVCVANGTGPAIYSVTVNVTGYTGTANLVLQLNGGAQVAVIQNGPATFSTKLAANAGYSVVVLAQPTPPNQTCSLVNGQGNVGTANVTVTVTCVTTNSVTVNVMGLSGAGLTLYLNGGDPLTVTNNGTSAFSTQLNVGTNYAVTVATQPVMPTQTCVVSNGTGAISASNVAVVSVACPLVYAPSVTNEWTLMTPAGLSGSLASGIFGAQGVPSAFNYPGARLDAAAWADSAGNLWLFGGYVYNALGFDYPPANDLWEYVPSAGTWTFVGSTSAGFGDYGFIGIATPANFPGSRAQAAVATDASGNFWLFGGDGNGAPGSTAGDLNDLWEFNPATGYWVWLGGATSPGGTGVYGQQGTPSTANVPGARQGAVAWVDHSGNVWIFGGQFFDVTTQTTTTLNDLWKFTPSAGTWTWVSGSVAGTVGLAGPGGVYGTKGAPAASNVPGARYAASAWTDGGGNLWLFGGYGNDATGSPEYLNDLWKFNPATSQWTWVGGSNVGGANGSYGTQGVAAASNAPGGRNQAGFATDANGNFWLFGGGGLAATGSSNALNDLWMFDPTTALWTWVSGSSAGDAGGAPGTPGVPAAANAPLARYGASFWAASGNLWLESGVEREHEGIDYFETDFWVYTPAP